MPGDPGVEVLRRSTRIPSAVWQLRASDPALTRRPGLGKLTAPAFRDLAYPGEWWRLVEPSKRGSVPDLAGTQTLTRAATELKSTGAPLFDQDAQGHAALVSAGFAAKSGRLAMEPGTFNQLRVRWIRPRWLIAAAVVVALGLLVWALPGRIGAFAGGADDWLGDHSKSLTAVGALGSFLAVIVAVGALLRQYEQVRITATAAQNQLNTAKSDSSRDCLWHFTERWRALGPKWALVVQSLKEWSRGDRSHPELGLGDQGEQALGAVLDFFDGMAFMANRDHLEYEKCWNWFYEELTGLWAHPVVEEHVRVVRESEEDLQIWAEIDVLIERIEEINTCKKMGPKAPAPGSP